MKALLPFFIRSLHVSTSLMSLVFFVGLVRGFPLGETQSGLYKLILYCGPGQGGKTIPTVGLIKIQFSMGNHTIIALLTSFTSRSRPFKDISLQNKGF